MARFLFFGWGVFQAGMWRANRCSNDIEKILGRAASS